MSSTPVSLVLASSSPARRRILLAAGVEPSVCVSGVDEEAVIRAAVAAHGPLDPEDVVLTLARAKADAVAASLAGDHLVLGCDSILELDGALHGKPGTSDEAAGRWRLMRGRSGILHTGHWLVDDRDDSTGATLGATASTVVHFADITDADIDSYVATGEPHAVAGGFTIDGLGAPYIERIEGDPSTVVGLSLPLLRELLGEIGLSWSDIMQPQSHY